MPGQDVGGLWVANLQSLQRMPIVEIAVEVCLYDHIAEFVP